MVRLLRFSLRSSLLWSLSCGTAGASEWVEALILASAQDGLTRSEEELAPVFDALCASGTEAACGWRWPFRSDTIAASFGPACDGGDAAACLMVGWALAQEPWGTFSPDRARDPDGARERFQRACDLGLKRGCTEVAHAYHYGIGTYANPRKAAALLEPLCEEGEPRACRTLASERRGEERVALLTRASDLGDAVAGWSLSLETADPESRLDLARSACELGVVSACEAILGWTEAPEVRAAALEAGCRVGDASLCTRNVLWQAERGRTDVQQAAEALAELCPTSPEACTEAAFLAQGVPPRALRPGRLAQQTDLSSLQGDLFAPVFACYIESLVRAEERVEGAVELDVRIGPEGQVEGMRSSTEWVDEPMQDCLGEAARGIGKVRKPQGGAASVPVTVALGHTAHVSFRPRPGLDAFAEMQQLGEALRDHSDDFDACAVRHGTDIDKVHLEVRVNRAGRVKRAEMMDLTGAPELDGCLLDLLDTLELPSMSGPLPGWIVVDFLRPVAPETTAEELPRPSWKGDPVEWRVLVVSVVDNVVDGAPAKLDRASLRSIHQVHEEAADWIATHTDGQVQVVVEHLEVAGPIAGAFEEATSTGLTRWRVEPADVPPELFTRIAPSRYHSVYLWIPIPPGFPRPALGTAWGTTSLRGALFASSPLPSGFPVHASGGMPPFSLVLHELYHHLETRAWSHLGTRLPSNHEVARLSDGRVYNPRVWLGATDAMAWYEWAFREGLHPDLWTDLLSYGQDVNVPRPGNLAYDAAPSGSEGVASAHQINDAVLDFGDLPHAAVADEAEPWVALAWPEGRRVGRVVAHLSEARRVAIEVKAEPGGPWMEVAVTEVGEPVVEISFAPVDAVSLRLRVVERGEGPFACRELEVYGDFGE